MTQAGVIPISTNAVVCEFQRTWNRPDAADSPPLRRVQPELSSRDGELHQGPGGRGSAQQMSMNRHSRCEPPPPRWLGPRPMGADPCVRHCNSWPASRHWPWLRPPAPGTPSDGTADLIVRNARVTTLDDARPEAAAFAVRGEKFVAVGGEEEVMRRRGDRTRVVDAGGRRVIPGLNDSHIHAVRAGRFYNLELRWDGVESLERALRMIPNRRAARRRASGCA